VVQALLQFIISNIATLLGITQSLQQQTAHSSQEPTPFYTSDRVFQALNDLESITFGLFALHNQLLAIRAEQDVDEAAILAAIGTPQQAGVPVTLPAPPVGYGFPGLGSGDAATIWNYQFPPGSGNIMGDLLVDAGWGAEALATSSALPHAYTRYALLHMDWTDTAALGWTVEGPAIDPTTILPTDVSILAWLNRTTAPFTWTLVGDQIVSFHGLPISDAWWICTITDLEFTQYKAFLAPPTVVRAPLWPGLAKAVLGAPVALSAGLQIVTPMDGVIVKITSLSPRFGSFPFGAAVSYRNIGALSFFDDDGEQEFPQTLGFTDCVYCPKSMVRAAGLRFRCDPSVVGTATPWTIAP
jgi:hypothetical protein